MALQGEARKLYHREYMRRQREGCPRGGRKAEGHGAVVLRMRPPPEPRADRDQLEERLPPLPVLLRGGRRSVRRGARRA